MFKNKTLSSIMMFLFMLSFTFVLSACTKTVEAITIDKDSEFNMTKGESVEITVVFQPEKPKNFVLNWSSSNEAVLTISTSNNGQTCTVTAVAKGTSIVTVVYGDTNISASAEITVDDPQGDLASAKNIKIAEINDLLNTYNEDDYSEGKWAELVDIIDSAKNSVNSATTIAGVTAISISTIKTQCDVVKTIATEEAEALDKAKSDKLLELNNLFADYNEDDYSEGKWAELVDIIDSAKNSVNSATLLSQVDNITISTIKTSCDEIGILAFYIVRHLQENLTTGWTTKDSETIYADSGDQTTAIAKNYTGFEARSITQEVINKNNTTIVSIYYDRIKYNINIEISNPAYGSVDQTTVSARFGSDIANDGLKLTIDKTEVTLIIENNTKDYVYEFEWENGMTTVNNTITVTAKIDRKNTIASVDGEYFATLDKAIENANTNDTLIIIRNATLSKDTEILANIEIESGATLTIAENTTIVIRGINGDFVNNGTIISNVVSANDIHIAKEYANIIKLKSNISERVKLSQLSDTKEFTIDLNGYTLLAGISITNKIDGNYTSAILSVSIVDTSTTKTGKIVGPEASVYGIIINGNEGVSVTLTSITVEGYYGAIYTNGSSSGGEVTATNCTFVANNTTNPNISSGAYLAGNYTYTFTDCSFIGASAIHIKSGTLTLNNCTLSANGEYAEPSYHGNGANITGNALMVEPTVGGYHQTLKVIVNGGTISSENGYAVEEYASAAKDVTPIAYATVVLNNVSLLGYLEKVKSQNNKVTIQVSSAEQFATATTCANNIIIKILENFTITAGNYNIENGAIEFLNKDITITVANDANIKVNRFPLMSGTLINNGVIELSGGTFGVSPKITNNGTIISNVASAEQFATATTYVNNIIIKILENFTITAGNYNIENGAIEFLNKDITITVANDANIKVNRFPLMSGTLINNGVIELSGGTFGVSPKITNNGTIISNVASANDIQTAKGYANIIKLKSDISAEVKLSQISATKEFTIDLNGYTLLAGISITNRRTNGNYTSAILSVSIVDTSTTKTGKIVGPEASVYGITIDGNEGVSVTLTSITVEGYYGAIYTNGSGSGGEITATNCTFVANNTATPNDSSGAYLAGNYTYTFTDCSFIGASAIHIKSGTLTLNNCTLSANGEYAKASYHGSGANITGNALMVEPTVGYHQTLEVIVNGGTISSENGYAVEEYASAAKDVTPIAYATVTINDCELIATEKVQTTKSQNNVITINPSE